MREHNIQRRLQEIRRIMLIQYVFITILIIAGALNHVIQTQQWSTAVKIGIALFTCLTLFLPAIYSRAKQLAKDFDDVLE
jgi:uncharacterized membrane protein